MAENQEHKAAEEKDADKKAAPKRSASSRGHLEAAEAAVTGGAISAPQAAALAQGADDDVVANMEETRIRQKLGHEVHPADFIDDDKDPVRRAAIKERDDFDKKLAAGPAVIAPSMAIDAAIRARPAEKVDTVTRLAEPGLTARGWSPEVTARHPAVVAEIMAELASTRGSKASFEGIDPTDMLAVETALLNAGFTEVRKDQLKAEAHKLAFLRLAAAQDVAAQGDIHTQAAHEQAVSRAEFEADHRGGTAPPTQTEMDRAR
jgi:hypothetical protein